MAVFITPHPPIIVGDIGGGREKEAQHTIDGMLKLAKDVAALNPKTIIVITPHGNVFGDALCINVENALSGDFRAFGYPAINLEFSGSILAQDLVEALSDSGIPCVAMDRKTARRYNVTADVDHGALVPLWYINKYYDAFDLVHINIGFLSKPALYHAGQIIAQTAGSDTVIIISGDLSHRLTHEAPAGYDDLGKVYDKTIVNAVKNGALIDILDMDDSLVEHAGQCAQKPLELMCGCFDGYDIESEVYSYEGPFGVGYMCAKIMKAEKTNTHLIDVYLDRRNEKLEKTRNNEDAYVKLARQTIAQYVKTGVKPNLPKGLDAALYQDKKGTFVSIKKYGDLRGCIGTIEPVRSNIAEEIIENAVSAATRDPRFNAITPDELEDLDISVDVLFEPEDIESQDELDVKEYGVIVSKGFRRGLLLPNLEGIDTIEEQVRIALSKAGIGENEDYKMQRFKVIRHK